MERVAAYKNNKCDFVRAPEHWLEKLSVEDGLLEKTKAVQKQITALLRCKVCHPRTYDSQIPIYYEPPNEITITVLRLLVLDLLALYTVLNRAVIKILGRLKKLGFAGR
jgi:hypothetical protein